MIAESPNIQKYVADAAFSGLDVKDIILGVKIEFGFALTAKELKSWMSENKIVVRKKITTPDNSLERLGFNPYSYKCVIRNIHDGDTITVEVDLGFDIKVMQRIRLWGINAPELDTPEGMEARKKLVSLLAPLDDEEYTVIVSTVKDRKEKYGRYLGVVYSPRASSGMVTTSVTAGVSSLLNVNEEMLNSGHAKVMKY